MEESVPSNLPASYLSLKQSTVQYSMVFQQAVTHLSTLRLFQSVTPIRIKQNIRYVMLIFSLYPPHNTFLTTYLDGSVSSLLSDCY